VETGLDLEPAIDCEIVKFFIGKAMDGFGRKSLPNLGFATFDLFAAFFADAFGKVREETCHCPSIVGVSTCGLPRSAVVKWRFGKCGVDIGVGTAV
jgi:hypothetical protein